MTTSVRLGKVTLTSGGVWNASTHYTRNTVVEHSDNTYLTLIDDLYGSEPSRSNSNYAWIGGKGDPGANGQNGANGAAGDNTLIVEATTANISTYGVTLPSGGTANDATGSTQYRLIVVNKAGQTGQTATITPDLYAQVTAIDAAIGEILNGTNS